MDYHKELEYLRTLERKGRAGLKPQIEALQSAIDRLTQFETLTYDELPPSIQDFITRRARELNVTPQVDSEPL